MTGTPTSKNPLRKQLDKQKYLHAAAYVVNNAGGIKKLTSNELMYLNQILSDDPSAEPWRFHPTHVELPSGQVHQLNVISNPLNRAREIVGDAYDISVNKDAVSAACYLYSQLVLEHLFVIGNRRTAALAALWLLQANGKVINPDDLLNIKVGDLRVPAELEEFKRAMQAL